MLRKSTFILYICLLSGTALSTAAMSDGLSGSEDLFKDWSNKEYGTGYNAKYYQWGKDSLGHDVLNVVEDSTEANITFKYDEASKVTDRINNPTEKTSVTGNFIGFKSTEKNAQGAAFYNEQTKDSYGNSLEVKLGDIRGNFVNNNLSPTQKGDTNKNPYGAAIYDVNGTIDNIIGNFINNSITPGSAENRAFGGAVYIDAVVNNIEGDFIGNHIIMNSTVGSGAGAKGGALAVWFNKSKSGTTDGHIGSITGNFIGNYIQTLQNGEGGALYVSNGGRIENLNADFIGNYIYSKSNSSAGSAYGGAVYIGSTALPKGIVGNFVGNYVHSTGSYAQGGAIYNSGEKDFPLIKGDFTGNYVQSDYSTTTSNYNKISGGAIYNGGSYSDIGAIDGNFTSNRVYASSKMQAYGGAINNNGRTIGKINGNFTKNEAHSVAESAYGGAISNFNGTIGGVSNSNGAKIESITGTFSNNTVSSDGSYKYAGGGAIYNNATINNISGEFEENKVQGSYAQGGAIYNEGTMTISNASFTGNTASGNTAQGGAIYSNKALTIKADNGINSVFHGNKTIAGGSETNNAIYMSGSNANLNLEANTRGTITFDDEIEASSNSTKINITGDNTGRIEFNNAVKNFGTLNSENVTIALGKSDFGTADLSSTAVTLNGGGLDMKNNTIQEVHMDSLNIKDNTKLSFDADIENENADKIITKNGASGNVSLQSINILKNVSSEEDEKKLQIFENNGESGDVNITFTNADDYAAYSKRYKYTFKDDNHDGSLTVMAEDNETGLNGAVSDTEESDKSYSVSGEGGDVVDDLGELAGDNFVIEGNNNTLDGEGFGGMITNSEQNITIRNVKSVQGFETEEDGGFIKNSGTLTVENSSIENNHSEGKGGAIWSDGTVNIVTNDGAEHTFSGNTNGEGDNNAIHMEGGNLNLQATKGTITFDDTIDGHDYALNIGGSSKGSVNINNTVSGADKINIKGGNINLSEDSHLNGNKINLQGGVLHLDNGKLGTAEYIELNGNGGQLHFDVNTVEKTSDLIKVGNLNGTVNVVAVNIGGDDKKAVAERDDNKIKFAEVTGENNGRFNILRVMNSAYKWDTLSEAGENGSTDWLMDVSQYVVPEVVAYLGLQTAGIEQTRNMLRRVEDKLFSGRYRMPEPNGYGGYRELPGFLYNVWASPVYSNSHVKSPIDVDADISGLEFGGDIQRDKRNRYGLFASLRKGKYDLNGKTDYWFSQMPSKIDIDSYLGGAYYRHVNNNFWATADIYGGVLKADLKTFDGVRTASDGWQWGGAAALGYDNWLARDLSLTPQARLAYMMQHWDDVRDMYGKTADYDNLSQIEVELGAKLQKFWSNNGSVINAWLMPSVVQTIVDGSDVMITDLSKVETVDNMTLGRIALGFNYYLQHAWNLSASVSYTFGKDYNNKEILIGANYAFQP